MFAKTICFAEALEVRYLTLAQELDRVAHIRVVDQPQQIVIG